MVAPRIAVLQFPGSNCEMETLRAATQAGLNSFLFRWNDDPARLRHCDGYIIGGGFSYQDRVRAGVIAAKQSVMEVVTRAAVDGKPVLGICNGAQVLVEAGLVPGIEPGRVELALAANVMEQSGRPVRRDYYCNWAFLRCAVDGDRSAFTLALREGDVLPLPFAHAEGRFTTMDEQVLAAIHRDRHIVFQYATSDGTVDTRFPATPNGSMEAIAGLCNRKGNVLALMPHPERAALLRMVPQSLPGPFGKRRREAVGDRRALEEAGPGHALFLSMARFLGCPAPACAG